MLLKVIGEWLNGRVMVSKTTGCVFESRLPCHGVPTTIYCGWDFVLPQYIDRCPKVALKVALKSFFLVLFLINYTILYFSENKE